MISLDNGISIIRFPALVIHFSRLTPAIKSPSILEKVKVKPRTNA